jgi:DNA topoisomerase-1
MTTLVIVESPGKIKTIQNYLGNDYTIKASIGHIQDLDKKTLSIDVENNFTPYYITSPDKIKVVNDLKQEMINCSDVILASDGDREGEAIAYSLATVLKIHNPKRIIFHEITKKALLKAINNPITINYDMVYAQQARRLLDRLMGYKISPLLWKHLATENAQSAGRVQSAVLNIIINKENEVNDAKSNCYLKTTCIFNYDKNKINSVLQYNNNNYIFKNIDDANNFIKNINKTIIFKVANVENKITTNKAPTPFITSSLQQEASSKLKIGVKQTMEIAQKLYELGLITYMRTDSPNISQTAIDSIQTYILSTYGEKYSQPKNYSSKNSTSQDAHECIRPTDINNNNPKLDNPKQYKLYNLIWKRTIASQMTNAKINVLTISIDAFNNKKSVLIMDKECPPSKTLFVSTLNNIEFDGYLIIYNNIDDENEDEKGKIDININDIVLFNKLKISQEYTKPPLRFNEALLVKFLEKNGIGRPSTYASIISKIIDRNYVEIKNIEGTKQKSLILELDNKYKIKESEKEISIGNEVSKITPTELGIKVNNYMVSNFEEIINISFTAGFETYLDKIAEGKANWITILKIFYDKFNPIVENLSKLITSIKEDNILGTYLNNPIFIGKGKFGPYIKIKNDDKWQYVSIKDNEEITLEDAITLLSFPKLLGKIGQAHVSLCNGKFGYYIKYNNLNYTIKNDISDINNIDLDFAKQIINNKKTFKLKDKIFNIKSGQYGPYIEMINKEKKTNISIPKKYNIDNITIDDIINIINSK